MLELLFARGGSARASARWVVCTALALAFIGVVIQFSVTLPHAQAPMERPFRQVLYVVGAVALATLSAAIGYERILKHSRPLLWLNWALLGVLLLPGMTARGGSVRWLDFGPVHLQPSELAKITMIFFLTSYASERGARIRNFFGGFLPALIYMAITGVLVILEPDIGQTLFLSVLSAAVLIVNGLRFLHFVPIFTVGVPALLLFLGDRWQYVRDRLDGHLGGTHFQVEHALASFARGGFKGEGFGEGQGHLFVPEIHNDFALAALAEQLGFLGCLGVVLLFVVLFFHGLKLAFLARTQEGFSVAFGIVFMIGLQAAVNIAVATGSVPPKGISIPFLSFGGSSLWVLGISVGLLSSVAAGAREPSSLLESIGLAPRPPEPSSAPPETALSGGQVA